MHIAIHWLKVSKVTTKRSKHEHEGHEGVRNMENRSTVSVLVEFFIFSPELWQVFWTKLQGKASLACMGGKSAVGSPFPEFPRGMQTAFAAKHLMNLCQDMPSIALGCRKPRSCTSPPASWTRRACGTEPRVQRSPPIWSHLLTQRCTPIGNEVSSTASLRKNTSSTSLNYSEGIVQMELKFACHCGGCSLVFA